MAKSEREQWIKIINTTAQKLKKEMAKKNRDVDYCNRLSAELNEYTRSLNALDAANFGYLSLKTKQKIVSGPNVFGGHAGVGAGRDGHGRYILYAAKFGGLVPTHYTEYALPSISTRRGEYLGRTILGRQALPPIRRKLPNPTFAKIYNYHQRILNMELSSPLTNNNATLRKYLNAHKEAFSKVMKFENKLLHSEGETELKYSYELYYAYEYLFSSIDVFSPDAGGIIDKYTSLIEERLEEINNKYHRLEAAFGGWPKPPPTKSEQQRRARAAANRMRGGRAKPQAATYRVQQYGRGRFGEMMQLRPIPRKMPDAAVDKLLRIHENIDHEGRIPLGLIGAYNTTFNKTVKLENKILHGETREVIQYGEKLFKAYELLDDILNKIPPSAKIRNYRNAIQNRMGDIEDKINHGWY